MKRISLTHLQGEDLSRSVMSNEPRVLVRYHPLDGVGGYARAQGGADEFDDLAWTVQRTRTANGGYNMISRHKISN